MTRCRAITLANQPDHLLTRCSLEEGHLRDHLPSFSEEDRNGHPRTDCPGHGFRKDLFHANPSDCPEVKQPC